jgi:hypothetical protein
VLDLDEATRAVTRLLRAGRAGNAKALDRLGRQRGWVMLTDAQRAIAAEHGYRSWRRLVEALTEFVPTTPDVALHGAEHLTLVPFLPDGSVVLVDERDHHALPAGRLSDPQAPLDLARRVALSKTNFLARVGRVFAADKSGSRIALWVDGEANHDDRRGRPGAVLWIGAPAEVAALLGRENSPGPAKLVLLADQARQAMEPLRGHDV